MVRSRTVIDGAKYPAADAAVGFIPLRPGAISGRWWCGGAVNVRLKAEFTAHGREKLSPLGVVGILHHQGHRDMGFHRDRGIWINHGQRHCFRKTTAAWLTPPVIGTVLDMAGEGNSAREDFSYIYTCLIFHLALIRSASRSHTEQLFDNICQKLIAHRQYVEVVPWCFSPRLK